MTDFFCSILSPNCPGSLQLGKLHHKANSACRVFKQIFSQSVARPLNITCSTEGNRIMIIETY